LVFCTSEREAFQSDEDFDHFGNLHHEYRDIGDGSGRAKEGPTEPRADTDDYRVRGRGLIPAKFTQSDPKPVSPHLQWTHVPANTVSFVLIMHDPDVAIQKKTDDVLHWLIFNIPGSAQELPENVPAEAKLPDGTIQGKNQGGVVGYRGPGAPAVGPHHHYTLELFALDTKLDLGPDATRPEVLKAIDGHILGKGVLVGRFHR
jgi:Raf kinase inhibitor-like YbhB/YbcL family protein